MRRATERGGDAFVDELAGIHRKLAAAVDADEFAACNDVFLGLIVDTAESPRVQAVLRVLSGLVPGNYFVEVPGALGDATARHRGDDARGAQARWRRRGRRVPRMMRRQGEAVIKLLDRRGFFDVPAPSG